MNVDLPLSQPSFAHARSIKREIVAELQESRVQGHPVQPEDLLAQWPADPDGDPDVAQLLFADFCGRFRDGENPSIADYQERFPEHQNSLASLVRQRDFLASIEQASGSSTTSLRLPSVQDEVFGFRLKYELGHGAFARVFLGEQLDLAGRPVVLKVSGIVGDEPKMLAQLQHTNIVPIYSLHEDQRAGLRAVCMPYFGGATLSDVMRALWADCIEPTRGHQIVGELAKLPQPPAESARHLLQPTGVTPLQELGKLSYVQAAVWIGARLAEALQHAHQRGVYHRDIKPSNILLSSDGQPMLLDFNLAHDLRESAAQATLGGTVAYMAPEHLQALATLDPKLASAVDQRSDIYSLGLVLYEMLLGRSAFEQTASYTPLRELIVVMQAERARGLADNEPFGTAIPPSLESIVRKCLAADPRQRYQQAEHLADDLRRFLADLPLRHAPETSRRERVAKWMRRHPRLTSSSSVAAVALVMLMTIFGALYGINELLQSARARERKQAFEAGAVEALCLVNTTTDLQDHLRQGVASCEETLALYEVVDRADWQNHHAWQRLDAADRHRLSEDIRELLILLAWARVQTQPGQRSPVEDALSLLERAEQIDGLPASPALARDRVHYLNLLGKRDEARAAQELAERLPPASPRDHYLLALSHARHKTRAGYQQAIAELDRALSLNPRHYWSLVQRGICWQELGESALAAGDFGQCVGLRPDFAWGYFNRGCVLDQTGHKAEAIRDYTAALEHEPSLLPAYVNRALAFLDRKQPADALADFQKACSLGRDDAFLHAGMALALEGLGRHSEADTAYQSALTRLESTSGPIATRIQLGYGFAVWTRAPDKAWHAFAAVLTQDAHNVQALYGQAMLTVEQAPYEAQKLTAAVRLLDQALQAQPRSTEVRRARAILQARRQQWKQAYEDIDLCLSAEPRSGATHYAAACVAALTAKYTEGEAAQRARTQALAFLRQAFDFHYGKDKAASDLDLAALRGHAEFARLVESSR